MANRLILLLMVGILLVVSAESFAATNTPPLDADNLKQAVAMVHTQAKLVTASMDDCARANPDYAFRFRLAQFIWQGENREDVAIAEKIFQDAIQGDPDAALVDEIVRREVAAFEAAMQQVPNICVRLANAISHGKKNVSIETPHAHAFLVKASPPDMHMVKEQERVDANVGCMKAYANEGHTNFDHGLAFCACNTEVMYTDMTEAQRNQLVANQARASELMQLPWMQALAPKMLKCAKALAN